MRATKREEQARLKAERMERTNDIVRATRDQRLRKQEQKTSPAYLAQREEYARAQAEKWKRDYEESKTPHYNICRPVVLAHVPNNLYKLYEHHLMLESKYNLENLARLIGLEDWPEVRRITELWLADYANRATTRHLLEREAQQLIDNL